MYISPKASRIRQREAQRARDNRAEIVKALSLGQITRCDLIPLGHFHDRRTVGVQERPEPLARSAFAEVPTGTLRSPLFKAQKFFERLNRLNLQHPSRSALPGGSETDAVFGGAFASEPYARRLSYHTDFSRRRA